MSDELPAGQVERLGTRMGTHAQSHQLHRALLRLRRPTLDVVWRRRHRRTATQPQQVR